MDMTLLKRLLGQRLLISAAVAASVSLAALPVRAETPPEAVEAAEQAPEPLSPEELEILVARIALYPDELVALISAASLYPLQIVEAERFLEDSKTKKDLKPKATWDGSVVSLLNYPEVVKMMGEDLDWTQLLGEAIVNQQQDVLAAIQQLREQAVANGVIKTDEKVKVVKEADNILIEPASKEVIYVPQYQPEMLYEPGYAYAPVTYYPDPYPYYWNPAATWFAGAVTGAVWAAAVDWDDGFWGGDWNHYHNGGWGNDINIDCNKCIIGSDFNGKLNVNNVDWRKVDRSKINYNKNDFNKIDNSKFKNGFSNNKSMRLDNKANTVKGGNRANVVNNKGNFQGNDIRKSTLDNLKKQNVKPSDKMAKPGSGNLKPGADFKPSDKMARPANLDRPVGKPKPASKLDSRPDQISPLGDVTRGRDAMAQSKRGNKSMGGGVQHPDFKLPSGGGGNAPKLSAPKHKISGGGGGGGVKRKRRH
jgi:hypothetical protein